jgi:hypothetical protein
MGFHHNVIGIKRKDKDFDHLVFLKKYFCLERAAVGRKWRYMRLDYSKRETTSSFRVVLRHKHLEMLYQAKNRLLLK